MSNVSENIDDFDQESDDEYFQVKKKCEEYSEDEEDGEGEDGEGGDDGEEEDDEGEAEEAEEVEEAEEAEEDELNEFNMYNEKIEEDIFNENNLLHSIKTREVLEQEILVLFSNMLKKETILNKEVKSNISVDLEPFKGDNIAEVAHKEVKESEKNNLKIKNKEVYDFICSKMSLNSKGSGGDGRGGNDRGGDDRGGDRRSGKREDKSVGIIHTGRRRSEEVSILQSKSIQQMEKEHYILDTNVVHILKDINTYLKREREYINRK
ncbi:conserved Plasmodium protein, unknown function, partial [Plasmodium ovale curtisi]